MGDDSVVDMHIQDAAPETVVAAPRRGSIEKQLTARALKLKALVDDHKNVITSMPLFKTAVKSAFQSVDLDNSGRVDVNECYIAVLLFYSKMGAYVKGLLPPKLKDIQVLFADVASDEHPGDLDVEEFTALLIILMENVGGRVLFQIVLAFFVTPVVANLGCDLYYRFYVQGNALYSMVFSKAIITNMIAAAIVSAARRPRRSARPQSSAARAATPRRSRDPVGPRHVREEDHRGPREGGEEGPLRTLQARYLDPPPPCVARLESLLARGRVERCSGRA